MRGSFRVAPLLVLLASSLMACGGAVPEIGDEPTADGGSDLGTLDGSAGDGANADGSGADGSGADGSVGDATASDGADGGSGVVDGALPPGSTILPDGGILLPDGAVVAPGTPLGPCIPGPTACTNCKDDDGDGLVDWMDPECTSPLDNDESSYATGIPGDNIDPCRQDCFFDGNSGAGDDGCDYALGCTKETATAKCPYDPKLAGKPQCKPLSDKCKAFCAPMTPKGCDCFGCCDVYSAGKLYTVHITSTCTTETLADPTKCETCTKNTECGTPCGKCDLCLGKLTVPPECYPPPADAGVGDTAKDGATSDGSTSSDGAATDTGTPPPPPPTSTCPTGVTACDSANPCATGLWCLTGCCYKLPA